VGQAGTGYKVDGVDELAPHSEVRRMSRNSLLSIALNNHYLTRQGIPLHRGSLGALQIRRQSCRLIAGHCFFGTAVRRTRIAGGVGAGGANAPRYPIGDPIG